MPVYTFPQSGLATLPRVGYPGSPEPSSPGPGPPLGSQVNQKPTSTLDETRVSSLPGVTSVLWGRRGLEPVAKLQRVQGGWGPRVASWSAHRTRPPGEPSQAARSPLKAGGAHSAGGSQLRPGLPRVCLASATSPGRTGTPSPHLWRLLGDYIVLNMVVGTAVWSEWVHKEPLIPHD